MAIPPYDKLIDWVSAELRAEGSRGALIAGKALTWLHDNPPPSALYDHDHTPDEALNRMRNAVAEQIIATNQVEPDRAEAIRQLDQAVHKVQEMAKVNPEDWSRDRSP